jgi:hypothetical protein
MELLLLLRVADAALGKMTSQCFGKAEYSLCRPWLLLVAEEAATYTDIADGPASLYTAPRS